MGCVPELQHTHAHSTPTKHQPFLLSHRRSSANRMDLIKNSSDLSSGRRPISKSDEFSIRSILVLEITGREFDTFPKNVYTYWDFGSIELR